MIKKILALPPRVEAGQRIRLVLMENDPNPIKEGEEGVVQNVVEGWEGDYQIWVKWDNGRNLALIHPVDKFEVVK